MSQKRPSLELEINNLAELKMAVHTLLEFAENRPTMVFSGEIGAGKTTFIQAICQYLGVNEAITSPTFSLINEYTITNDSGKTQLIYHMDLYRLKHIDEALGIGIEEYLDDQAYCFIEWPEVIEELLPADTVWINISILSDSTRKILIL